MCACACLLICQRVCEPVSKPVCLSFCVRVCLPGRPEIWDWRPAPFYVDKLELTVNRRAHFEGLFRLRLEADDSKI